VVRRGGELVKADPHSCAYVHPAYTEEVDLPEARVAAEGADWKAEELVFAGGGRMLYIQYKKVFDELDRCFSAARGCKLLLYGPPGTGKSSAAKFFAKKWGVKLHVFSPGAILSKYLGETEQNLREALDHARRGDAVLLDEFEVFAMQREKVAEMKIATVQVLLTELQELSDGIVIATTNADPSLIDPALRRGGRLRPVAVPLPTREMLEVYARYRGAALDERAQSFAEVEDPRDAFGTEWYYLLPPVRVARLGYTIRAERGIYRAVWGEVQEVALSLLWFYFSPRRQVWWVRKPRSDYSYVIDMADSYGAVVFVDDLIAADFAKFLRPVRSALVVFHRPPPGLYAPPLSATVQDAYGTYALEDRAARLLEDRATKLAAQLWLQQKPQCRSASEVDAVVRAVWGSC